MKWAPILFFRAHTAVSRFSFVGDSIAVAYRKSARLLLYIAIAAHMLPRGVVGRTSEVDGVVVAWFVGDRVGME